MTYECICFRNGANDSVATVRLRAWLAHGQCWIVGNMACYTLYTGITTRMGVGDDVPMLALTTITLHYYALGRMMPDSLTMMVQAIPSTMYAVSASVWQRCL